MSNASSASAARFADAFFNRPLAESDAEVFGAIEKELGRQRHEIELIASENIVSRAVLEAQGSVLTNKYAEGYPGRRYYGGCQYVDVAEKLAIDRVTQLFGCGFANVQPNSGSQANQAVFLALFQARRHHSRHEPRRRRAPDPRRPPEPLGQVVQRRPVRRRAGDRPDRHTSRSRNWRCEHRPKIIIAGGSAYSRRIDFARFREIADKVGAYLLVDMAHFAGLVAGGVHPSPFPHAHVVTSTTHKTLRGPRGGIVLTNDEDIAKKINSAVFPGLQGGPLMHVIAAKAVAFGEALTPEFKIYAQDVRERQGARRDARRGRPRHRLRRHRHPPDAGRSASEEPDRQGVGGSARPRQHHLQQERRSLRSGKADGDLRRPPRHAGRHDPRLRHAGVPRDRPADRRGARRPQGGQFGRGQRRGRGGGQGEGRGADRPVPDLPARRIGRRQHALPLLRV